MAGKAAAVHSYLKMLLPINGCERSMLICCSDLGDGLDAVIGGMNEWKACVGVMHGDDMGRARVARQRHTRSGAGSARVTLSRGG